MIKLDRRVEQAAPYSKCVSITPCCPICKPNLKKQEPLSIYGYPFMLGESENYRPEDLQGTRFILRQEGRISKEGDDRILEYNP